MLYINLKFTEDAYHTLKNELYRALNNASICMYVLYVC